MTLHLWLSRCCGFIVNWASLANKCRRRHSFTIESTENGWKLHTHTITMIHAFMVPCPNARTQIHITWHSRYHKEYLWHKNITDKSLKKHDEKEWWNDWLQTVWKKSHQKHTAEARLNTQAERTPNSSTKGKYQKHGKAAEHLENTRTMPGEWPENARRMTGEWPQQQNLQREQLQTT